MLLFMRFPARLIRSATPRGVSPREGASLPTLPVGTPSTYRSYSRIRDANRPVWRVGLGASDSLMTVNSAIGLLMPLQIQVGMCRTATDHIHHLLRYASLRALTSQRADAEAQRIPSGVLQGSKRSLELIRGKPVAGALIVAALRGHTHLHRLTVCSLLPPPH